MLALAPGLASPRAWRLVLLGGGFYTIGIGFQLWRRLWFRRAISHGFVVAGAIAHYFAIADIVL